ncbi:DNA/RNA non-specific endonuclease [Lacrimispora sp. 210928-DFI.3.58]|uniref:DNA/RNA non-specific endonuclease n=1 Tax=Lacrimispora sp. 210928-DFI.3.58 TaxID=2883214 RepID=UPI001D07F846|nr:DNA/RNA non-specific endonuclease [Lacrimispora sp. 210928-DFI.3.58]MCB7320453.1 DNA/RNA non-specific endonuclease [Lacrimispora sp. 210928-DFI.3.58]
MKKIKAWLLAVVAASALAVSACGQASVNDTAAVEATKSTKETERMMETSQESVSESWEAQIEQREIRNVEVAPTETSFSLADIPTYFGQPYVAINDNVPFFVDLDMTDTSFESYSNLDNLGRCGVAYASVGTDLMPTEERGAIGSVKPTGWHTVKYDIVDGKYLYNRCHLIGYQLSGENANEKNLITGTRYLNVTGMLPFENMVADYVKETENHVLYRVTPVFEGENLVASGVLMEAKSVEDDGDGILYCVYVYNVQPGITIDYATGDSALSGEVISSEAATTAAVETTQATEPQGTTYILNTNTKKFHYPSCSSVSQMNESNKKSYFGSRDDVISQGYDPCKRCNP